MLRLALVVGVAATLALRHWPSCYTATCRQPFATRWRRFDDGQAHPLCGRCARHVDRLRAVRDRIASIVRARATPTTET